MRARPKRFDNSRGPAGFARPGSMRAAVPRPGRDHPGPLLLSFCLVGWAACREPRATERPVIRREQHQPADYIAVGDAANDRVGPPIVTLLSPDFSDAV